MWWFGEIPLLALVQVPKVEAAKRVRHFLVMKVFPKVGLSRGSYSPDWSRARPWGLGIVYVVVIGVVVGVVWVRRGITEPWRRWAIVMVGMGMVDYVMTMVFAGGPAVSMY